MNNTWIALFLFTICLPTQAAVKSYTPQTQLVRIDGVATVTSKHYSPPMVNNASLHGETKPYPVPEQFYFYVSVKRPNGTTYPLSVQVNQQLYNGTSIGDQFLTDGRSLFKKE